MQREPKTPVENAEEAVRTAEAEFARNPTDANEAKVRRARNFAASVKEFATRHPDFNRRPPEP